MAAVRRREPKTRDSVLYVMGVNQDPARPPSRAKVQVRGLDADMSHAEWLPDSVQVVAIAKGIAGQHVIFTVPRIGGDARVVHRLSTEHDAPGSRSRLTERKSRSSPLRRMASFRSLRCRLGRHAASGHDGPDTQDAARVVTRWSNDCVHRVELRRAVLAGSQVETARTPDRC